MQVLASDVAYESEQLPALLRTLVGLASPDAHILYAFEERPPVTDEALRLMPCYGLITEEVGDLLVLAAVSKARRDTGCARSLRGCAAARRRSHFR